MPRTSTALARELRVIRASFRLLASAFSRMAPLLGEHMDAVATASPSGKRPRRKPRLTAQQRAAQKLQGKYMGTMRGLKPADGAKVKRVQAEKGIRAAIRTAERMAG